MNVIITDMSCTKRVCGSLPAELWSSPPKFASVTATGLSAAHTKWVNGYQADHGGAFVLPMCEGAGVSDPDRVGMVGFSAGCWGVAEAVKSEPLALDFIYLVDGMHGGKKSGSVVAPAHFIEYGKSAIAGDTLMIVSFSAIDPGSYPGTRATARAMADVFGMSWSTDVDVAGLTAQEYSSLGNLHLVGAWRPGTPGNTGADHVYQCNQVQEACWKAFVGPFWNAPRVRAPQFRQPGQGVQTPGGYSLPTGGGGSSGSATGVVGAALGIAAGWWAASRFDAWWKDRSV